MQHLASARTARVFVNGNSQAVRLPREFRLAADEVFIRKLQPSGDILLSLRPPPGAWTDFFELRAKTRLPADFLLERPLNETAWGRDPLAPTKPAQAKPLARAAAKTGAGAPARSAT